VSQTTLRTAIPRSDVPLRELWPHAGVRVFFAYWGALVVVDVADGTLAVAAAAIVVAACSAHQHAVTVIAVAVEAWLFLVAFLGDGNGALALHGTADAVRLLLLLTVATTTAALTAHPAHRRGDR
jgi:hypothetical protein